MKSRSWIWWAVLAALVVLAFAIPVRGDDILGQDCEEAYLFEPGSEVKCQKETEFNMWTNLFVDANEFIMEGVKDSTTGYRDVQTSDAEVQDIKNSILAIANALAVLVLVYGGYLWIISATDPKIRNKARRQIVAAMYMLIFLNAGFFIANLGYELGTKTASYLEVNTEEFFEKTPWEQLKEEYGGNDIEDTYNKFSSLAVASPILLISGWCYTSLMYLRNMVIILLVALAPLIVVLFFFEPTKPYGKLLALLFGVELFLPVLFFPLFKISTLMFKSGEHKINILIMAATLMIAVLLHIVVVGVAMVKSAGSFWVKEEED